MTTQTDPNIDPAERREHFWPTGTADAAIDELRARLLPPPEHRTAGQRRGSDDHLARLLDATQAHELDLLEQVSTAHSDGYGAAVEQLRGLLDWVFAEAPVRHLAGLASALSLLDRLRPAAHRVTLTSDAGTIVLTLECAAGVGAPCRVTCEGAVAGRCDERCDCDEPSLVDGGNCLAAAWLNDYDPPDFLDARIGRPDDRVLSSAPVAVRWSRADEAWQWAYVVDLPDGVTAEEWERVQP